MKTIGVFFGSRSPEHDVSIITAQLIISGLKQLKYPVVPIYITKQGEWCLGEELSNLSFFQNPHYEEKLQKNKKYVVDLEASFKKIIFKRKKIMGKAIAIDIAFPAFHGQNGEDGTIQGLFEIFNIPYVGCDVTSSAVTMDKVLTKLLYEKHDIPTTKSIFFEKKDWEENKERQMQKVKERLKLPLFVKPARLGSSIGITKVKEEKNLEFAIEVALHYDPKVLIEEGVENVMDVTCAVLGNENPKPSALQESLFAGSDFYDYDEKYIKDGGSQLGKAESGFRIPASLNEAKTKEIQEKAVRVFKLLGCSGIARVDFLFDKTTDIAYANEVNTLPGTLYHHLWKASGVNFEDLLKELIRLAEERYSQKKKITHTFESSILRQASSQKLKGKLHLE